MFESIPTVLAEAGATMADIVKLNTYDVFKGKGDEIREFWEKMTSVRMEYSRPMTSRNGRPGHGSRVPGSPDRGRGDRGRARPDQRVAGTRTSPTLQPRPPGAVLRD